MLCNGLPNFKYYYINLNKTYCTNWEESKRKEVKGEEWKNWIKEKRWKERGGREEVKRKGWERRGEREGVEKKGWKGRGKEKGEIGRVKKKRNIRSGSVTFQEKMKVGYKNCLSFFFHLPAFISFYHSRLESQLKTFYSTEFLINQSYYRNASKTSTTSASVVVHLWYQIHHRLQLL